MSRVHREIINCRLIADLGRNEYFYYDDRLFIKIDDENLNYNGKGDYTPCLCLNNDCLYFLDVKEEVVYISAEDVRIEYEC